MEFDRRTFLKVSIATGLGLALGLKPSHGALDLGVEPEPEEPQIPKILEPIDYLYDGLSREQALLFYRSIQKNIEFFRPLAPDPPDTLKKLKKFGLEVLPYFLREGISDKPAKPLGDKDIQAIFFSGNENFYYAGVADSCLWGGSEVNINKRFFNKYSPLYRRNFLTSTIIHELSHREGICVMFDEDEEPAAQLAATEVMAAMVWHRNKYALMPFMLEMASYSDDYLLYHSLKDDNLDWYIETVIKELPNPAWTVPQFERALDSWKKGGMEKVLKAFEKYGVKPYIYLTEAMNNEESETRVLPVPNSKKLLVLDDTKYLLSNLTKLLSDLPPSFLTK